jgi:hypothetical protein
MPARLLVVQGRMAYAMRPKRPCRSEQWHYTASEYTDDVAALGEGCGMVVLEAMEPAGR